MIKLTAQRPASKGLQGCQLVYPGLWLQVHKCHSRWSCHCIAALSSLQVVRPNCIGSGWLLQLLQCAGPWLLLLLACLGLHRAAQPCRLSCRSMSHKQVCKFNKTVIVVARAHTNSFQQG